MPRLLRAINCRNILAHIWCTLSGTASSQPPAAGQPALRCSGRCPGACEAQISSCSLHRQSSHSSGPQNDYTLCLRSPVWNIWYPGTYASTETTPARPGTSNPEGFVSGLLPPPSDSRSREHSVPVWSGSSKGHLPEMLRSTHKNVTSCEVWGHACRMVTTGLFSKCHLQLLLLAAIRFTRLILQTDQK